MFKNISLPRIALAVLLVAIPLYPKFPLFSVNGTYVAIRLDDIFIAIAAVILLADQIKNKFSFFKLPVSKLFLAYFIAITISFLNAFLIFKTDPTNVLFLNLLRRFEYMSLFFLAIAAVKSVKDLSYPFIFSVIASIGVAAYGLGQKYFHFPIISTMNAEFSQGELLQMDVWTRISSTFAGHYDLAAYLSVFLIILGTVVILQKKLYLKLPGIALWLLLYWILTLTASRVSIFAYIVGMVIALILIRKYLYILPVLILFAFSIFDSGDLSTRLLATIPSLEGQINGSPSSVVVPTLTPTPPPANAVNVTPIPLIKGKHVIPIPTPFRHQFVSDFIPVDVDAGVARSGEIRFNVEWPRALTAFHKNPLSGTGLGSITLATDNDYLRLLGESGLLGLITFLAIFVYFGLRTLPLIRKKEYLPLIFFASMITMLANATLIDVFEASKPAYLFWIMMGIYYQVLEFSSK